jgi:hypothetical protein
VHKLQKISTEIIALTADVRAEVLLSQAMNHGLLQKEFDAQADGFFYRAQVPDLYKINLNTDKTLSSRLHLQLSRPGLYDALPEGIFFQMEKDIRTVKSAAEMAEEYRVNKKKENEIRKFFAPFENEFFLQTTQNEMVETNLLQGLRSGWLKEYFIDFWKLPQDIPTNAALVMVMFLPYVHQIAGDMKATEAVLQKIINEPVNIVLQYAFSTNTSCENNVLGKYRLGTSLVCGDNMLEQYPMIQINIGPLKKSKAFKYVEGGNYFSLLQTFCNYFIPANAVIQTNILLDSTTEKFVLNNNEDAPLLGISSVV